jgi:hypothetical protein
MKQTVIPKHEPEVLKFVAGKMFGGEIAQVPDCGLRKLTFHDIHLTSEGKRAAEYDALIHIVACMPPEQRDYVLSVTAEGNHTYSARVATDEPSMAAAVAQTISQACQRLYGGHNAVVVLRKNGLAVRVASQWGGVLG